MLRKRPYKVLHSYVERRYTVVCNKECCTWRVCSRKQKDSRKWKITKVVGPHTCAEQELTSKHRQLSSTLIAKRLMGILKGELTMMVRTIISTVKELYGFEDPMVHSTPSSYIAFLVSINIEQHSPRPCRLLLLLHTVEIGTMHKALHSCPRSNLCSPDARVIRT